MTNFCHKKLFKSIRNQLIIPKVLNSKYTINRFSIIEKNKFKDLKKKNFDRILNTNRIIRMSTKFWNNNFETDSIFRLFDKKQILKFRIFFN
jgi:hypothetical protein